MNIYILFSGTMWIMLVLLCHWFYGRTAFPKDWKPCIPLWKEPDGLLKSGRWDKQNTKHWNIWNAVWSDLCSLILSPLNFCCGLVRPWIWTCPIIKILVWTGKKEISVAPDETAQYVYKYFNNTFILAFISIYFVNYLWKSFIKWLYFYQKWCFLHVCIIIISRGFLSKVTWLIKYIPEVPENGESSPTIYFQVTMAARVV